MGFYFYKVKHPFTNKKFPDIKVGDIIELDDKLARLAKDCIEKIPQKVTMEPSEIQKQPNELPEPLQESKPAAHIKTVNKKNISQIQKLSGQYK